MQHPSRSRPDHCTAPHPSRRNRGFTIVELMIVLAVGVALISAAIALFSTIRANMRANNHKSDLVQIISKAQSVFGASNLYGDVTTAIAVGANTFPDGARIPGTATAQNRYGGLWSVAPATLVSANDALALTDPNVHSPDCFNLVAAVAPMNRRVSVAGSVVKVLDGNLDTAAARAACESAQNVAIVWEFGRSM